MGFGLCISLQAVFRASDSSLALDYHVHTLFVPTNTVPTSISAAQQECEQPNLLSLSCHLVKILLDKWLKQLT